jgi:hypothetical protein
MDFQVRLDAGVFGEIPTLVRATRHAGERMARRGIRARDIAWALHFGRRIHVRGADVFVIGRKEVALAREDGIDLSHHEGLQVLCSPEGDVITLYKNRRFKETMRT